MMLVTTSRKPGQLTRSVARTLAKAFGAEYLNRGKAGMDSVLGHAETLGISHVLFVWEKNGNPARLVAFDGDWIEPEIKIQGIVFPRKSFRGQGGQITVEDDFGQAFQRVFKPEPGPNQILLSRFKLSLINNGELLLELRFKED
ncbi:hypothetical protein HY572_01205 [Candidatus Micrarchaeota archaeon]|nr:hypothetical protein [Candidatus Micrarchaeota archaeon]